MRKNIVKLSAFQKLIWPRFCNLCLKPAEVGDKHLIIGEGEIPYCNECYVKIQRLRKWEDNIFGISFFIGILGGILYFISMIIEGEILVLGPIIGTVLFFGLSYVLLQVLFIPLRIIFHSKLAKPGIKILKSKEPNIMILKFSNPEYADMFREANQLSVFKNF